MFLSFFFFFTVVHAKSRVVLVGFILQYLTSRRERDRGGYQEESESKGVFLTTSELPAGIKLVIFTGYAYRLH